MSHGGNIYDYKRVYGKYPLDFSVNISPLGLPDGIKESILFDLSSVERYPEESCLELKEGFAKRLCEKYQRTDIAPEDILCGNGAADLIYRFAYALHPRCVLLTAPGFVEYETVFQQVDSEIVHYQLYPEDDFTVKENIIDQIRQTFETANVRKSVGQVKKPMGTDADKWMKASDMDLVVLTQPNNPTGKCIDASLYFETIEECQRRNIWVLCDESFLDFCPDIAQKSVLSRPMGERVILIKSFTKIYAIAGLRLGYAVTKNAEIREQMENLAPPWNVSSLAQVAGLAALKEEAYVEQVRQLLAEEKEYLKAEMSELPIQTTFGDANFLLFYSEKKDLWQLLCEKGILVRDCSDFEGLGEGYFRVAIKTHPQNEALVTSLKEILAAD